MQDGIDSLQSARGSSTAGAARNKGAILSRERMAPFDPQENGRGKDPTPPPKKINRKKRKPRNTK